MSLALGGGDMDIRSGQKLAWQNKVAKGLKTTDVPLAMMTKNAARVYQRLPNGVLAKDTRRSRARCRR